MVLRITGGPIITLSSINLSAAALGFLLISKISRFSYSTIWTQSWRRSWLPRQMPWNSANAAKVWFWNGRPLLLWSPSTGNTSRILVSSLNPMSSPAQHSWPFSSPKLPFEIFDSSSNLISQINKIFGFQTATSLLRGWGDSTVLGLLTTSCRAWQRMTTHLCNLTSSRREERVLNCLASYFLPQQLSAQTSHHSIYKVYSVSYP